MVLIYSHCPVGVEAHPGRNQAVSGPSPVILLVPSCPSSCVQVDIGCSPCSVAQISEQDWRQQTVQKIANSNSLSLACAKYETKDPNSKVNYCSGEVNPVAQAPLCWS